jgi:hypothetical protein
LWFIRHLLFFIAILNLNDITLFKELNKIINKMKMKTYSKINYHNAFYSGLIILTLFLSSALQAQTLTVQNPNGGEVWMYGGTEIAYWTGNNLSSIVTVEFSYDGGTNWLYFGEVPTGPNGGSATISVPNTSTTNAFLRFTDVTNPAATDVSDGPFTVLIPSISIWEPGEGSYVFTNTLAQVSWTVNVTGINLLNAEISIDNGQTFTLVGQNINAQLGSTYLELSDTPSDSCILKLYNAEDPSTFGLSDVFIINPVPVYTLTSPSAGDIVNTTSPFTITWTVENPYSPNCYLFFSDDNGATWEFINNGVSQGNSGSYEWTTPNVDSDECLVRINDSYVTSSDDISEVFSIFPFPETPICMVSVDSLTNYNVIIWQKPTSDMIADFLVYKETDEANVYEVIDTVSYESAAIVVDSNSNPSMQPYRYKLAFVDSLERLFPLSDYHQTMHLTINQGVNNAWNLIWTSYTGFDYTSYKILRKTASGSYEQIATVSASFNSFTDFNAPPGEVSYIIKIENPAGCNPAMGVEDYNSIYSNKVTASSLVSVSESYEANFSIYPSPADGQINVKFSESISGMVRFTFSDLTGRTFYSGELNDAQQGQVQVINTAGLREGMYILTIINAGGKSTKKVVIRH